VARGVGRSVDAVGGAWRHRGETEKEKEFLAEHRIAHRMKSKIDDKLHHQIIHCHFFLQVCHIAILIVEILKATLTTYAKQYCK